jgi:hypothetical protein
VPRDASHAHRGSSPPDKGARWCAEVINEARLAAGLSTVPIPDDSKVSKLDALLVYANHGRWVVDCPCGSAQVACRTDHRFFCVECRNSWAGGRWAPVVWPKQLDDIEGLLDARLPKYAHWTPGEDVMTLVAENVAAGLGA